MGDHHLTPDQIKKDVRVYLLIFLALLVGTAVTVGLYYVHFEHVAVTITIALIVATIKGALWPATSCT